MRLTNNQLAVLNYLRNYVVLDGWARPTRIGVVAGGRTSGGLYRHSAWACRILRRLVGLGFAERRDPGMYRITQQGRLALYDDVQADLAQAEVTP